MLGSGHNALDGLVTLLEHFGGLFALAEFEEEIPMAAHMPASPKLVAPPDRFFANVFNDLRRVVISSSRACASRLGFPFKRLACMRR